MSPVLQPDAQATQAMDAYARRLAARLTHASDDLPHDISERLRVARMQAVAQRKRPQVQPVQNLQGATAQLSHAPVAQLGWGSEGGTWWRALVSAIPLVALVMGLIAIGIDQKQKTALEFAEVDTALLTDELPPAAYADPGFLQYLETTRLSQ
ncbi:hypothetical protein GCM10022279_19130 [Comamonas faecalis]|uniref:DUF3619 family protein n=1 Tax=Comamonas faecalis TaxID=1387849 RepID=A0ABP7RCE1_9BURK